jgi:hypothetical protein
VQFLKKTPSQTVFLVGAVVLPISILVAVQEMGFSLLNEKHCVGVVGAWYILVAAIMAHVSRYTWGKCTVVLYAFLIALSLFHFYLQPEIYSRRSNFTALNCFLTEMLNEDDLFICYSRHSKNQPDYLTILDKAEHCIDLYQDKPTDIGLREYVASFCDSYSGKIYFIYSTITRSWVDPDNCVLSFLMNQYDFTIKHYGRNLKLYEFSSEKAD